MVHILVVLSQALVSVIVPVYNVEAYLPHCLQAISEQTYRNLEIILVDDGSTDRSGQICDEFVRQDTRARVIHQPNSGLWAARNTGHDAAHGEYLFFPDADDDFHRDTIRLLFQAINIGDGYYLALCKVRITDHYPENHSIPTQIKVKEIKQEELFRNLFNADEGEDMFSVFMWNKLFRREAINDLRSENYSRSQDMDFMIRLFPSIRNAALIENRLYYWIQRPDSLTHTPEALFLYNKCRTLICYKDYIKMPEDGKQYGHYLLETLYVRMLFWRNQSWNRSDRNAVFSSCNNIIRNTWKDYIKCHEIPFWKRLVCILLAYTPAMTRLLMKVSKN